MKALRATAISAALAAISLIILTTACADSPQPQSSPPRAAVSAPAPTNTPTPPEPTPTSAPEPTAMPEPTATPEPTAMPEPTASAPAPEPTAAAPAPADTPAPSAPAQAPTGSPADMFRTAAAAMNALSSYRAEMEHIVTVDMMGAPGEIKTEVQADFQAPDKMGGDMTISLSGEPPIDNSFVIIGDDAYISLADPDNPQNLFWIQSAPADIAPLTSFLTWFETGSDYEFTPADPAATENLNGEETYRLRGSFVVKNLPPGVDQPEDMEADVWIGASDSLIRKIAASGAVEEIETELDITISYSRFGDSSIQIDPPSDFITP